MPRLSCELSYQRWDHRASNFGSLGPGVSTAETVRLAKERVAVAVVVAVKTVEEAAKKVAAAAAKVTKAATVATTAVTIVTEGTRSIDWLRVLE
eukprot:SAG31_NODE_2457_length_5661_cov_94.571557_5_plen_94_part_00